jgi:hypothetical protein
MKATTKPEAAEPAQLQLAVPARAMRDDPRFLQIYCSILNGLMSQFEVYGPEYDEKFGSAQKWPEDLFVEGRGVDAEDYRTAYLIERAMMAAQCAFALLQRADEDEEIEQFNHTVTGAAPAPAANHETNNH